MENRKKKYIAPLALCHTIILDALIATVSNPLKNHEEVGDLEQLGKKFGFSSNEALPDYDETDLTENDW